MKVRHASWLGLCAVIACSSQVASEGDTQDAVKKGCGDAGGGTDGGPPDASDGGVEIDAGPVRLVPSNLPPDTCDNPATTDLIVPAGTTTTIDANGPCDALIPQADGLPSICVHKYSKVVIAGTLLLRADIDAPRPPAAAIVATDVFSIDTGGVVDVVSDWYDDPREPPGAPDPRGEPAAYSGKGAGHITPGGGVGPDSIGGDAFGPTTGTQLVAGSTGAIGRTEAKFGLAGRAGGALQLVSCGQLGLSGTVTASGTMGLEGYYSVNNPGGGGGGGSGGTLVIEALRITGSGGSLTAKGGDGGYGGFLYGDPGQPSAPGGLGGAGGTGAAPPTSGQLGSCPERFCSGPGGGGGSVGRIVVNLPRDVPVPPDLTADPPASIGVVGTH